MGPSMFCFACRSWVLWRVLQSKPFFCLDTPCCCVCTLQFCRQRQDFGEQTEADRMAEEEKEILRHAMQAKQALKAVKELAQVGGHSLWSGWAACQGQQHL